MIATRPGAAAHRMYPSTTATFNGDLDYIAIEHAMNGELVTLTPAERIEAARQLDARGMNHAEVGRRVGANRSTVTAWQKNGWKAPVAIQDPDPIDIGGATHGRSGYTKGCRCRKCKDGASAAKRAAKAKAAA
ncbi:helix-turn-helix domain-containing protein [Streptomyces sp. NPDC005969]|uniref:helix-turn-helix domain-containing protein n=1 Tax=Streptomyces sp. NPDC005969 TaxID=3156722 RepID=UPI003406A2A0